MESFPGFKDCFRKINVTYDVDAEALWIAFASDDVPSFTVAVLEEIHTVCDLVAARAAEALPAIAYIVLSSSMDGIFNMGGDLGRMAELSRRGDCEGLDHYGRLTADLVHRMWTSLDRPLVTISAVDGDAFGGGFEAALSTNFLVAGPRARFAFPESRFGLFPGMGATSLIARRTSEGLAERLILDARTIDPGEARALGLCDRALRVGTAADFVRRAMRRGGRPLHARLLTETRARRRVAPYSHAEARGVVGVWAQAVLRLAEPRRRYIDRIVAAQKSRVARMAADETSP